MDARKKRIQILPKYLAEHFKGGDNEQSACACGGLDFVCLSCSLWWKLFLENRTRHDVEFMVSMFNQSEDHFRK